MSSAHGTLPFPAFAERTLFFSSYILFIDTTTCCGHYIYSRSLSLRARRCLSLSLSIYLKGERMKARRQRYERDDKKNCPEKCPLRDIRARVMPTMGRGGGKGDLVSPLFASSLCFRWKLNPLFLFSSTAQHTIKILLTFYYRKFVCPLSLCSFQMYNLGLDPLSLLVQKRLPSFFFLLIHCVVELQ